MRATLLFALFAVFLLKPDIVFSQTDTTFVELPDSIKEKEHSPTKATLMSTFLPGLGQVYNKKYWKVPIIYAGLGIMGYYIYTWTDLYIDYKCAYIESSMGNTNGAYSYLVNKYSSADLLSYRETCRRNLEISILLTTLWYGLNILDAAVDAHLYTFNINENLTMKVEPALLPAGYGFKSAGGVRLSFRF